MLSLVIYQFTWMSNPDIRLVLKGDESSLYRFVVGHLMDNAGGIYTNLREDSDKIEHTATGHQMLSESTGLMMLYAVKQNRKDLFAQQYVFLNNHLMDRSGLRWVVDKANNKAVTTNATIDDLLVVRSLLLAADLWKQSEYAKKADQIANGLWKNAQSDALLADFYNWSPAQKADTVTASYLDLFTLKMLSMRSQQWAAIYTSSKQLSDYAALDNGLYYKTFDLKSRTWKAQTEFNSIDFLYSALHRAEDQIHVTATVNFIKSQWTLNKKLANAYSVAGKEVSQDESPAVYALAFRLLKQVNQEPELAEGLYQRMLQLSVQDPASPYFGGFVDLNTNEAYSFDHLQALLAESERNNYP
ncbi:glycosyl hydrolase family 8 [Paenibacillus agricola]|nr:hypothetical protein [Paenibacillus agricola]